MAARTLNRYQTPAFFIACGSDFYLEGARQSDQAVRRIRAVDPLTTGWLTRGALVNFYQSNLRAIERGVQVTRIFVTGLEEFADPEVQKVLQAQLKDGVEVRLAFRDELPPAMDFSGSDVCGALDFVIYEDRAVTSVFQQVGNPTEERRGSGRRSPNTCVFMSGSSTAPTR